MTDGFTPLWSGGPVFCASRHFPLSTDSILLADFARVRKGEHGIDLGCGAGILTLLLSTRQDGLSMTGLELLPEAAALCARNLAANGLSDRSGVLTGDIRLVRAYFRPGSFDFAVSNPPYFPSGRGALSPDGERARARSESACTLDELCQAVKYLCRSGGRFFIVHRAERLSELFCAMSANAIEPKRLRLVSHRGSAVPSLALVEGRRDGRPGLTLEPELLLRDADGCESAECRRIYHRV
jgi:tRNA1(Val) A37 N6-methylase TrmN6